MKRRKFIWTALAAYPLLVFSKIKNNIIPRTVKGFKVHSGEDRFNTHSKMMGVTSNILDLKISSKDTAGQLSVFEQTGLTYKGGPPLHIHPNQDEMFYVIEGEYLYQVGDDKYQMKAGDTIFLPRGIPHAFVQLKEKGRLIVAYQPSGKMEEFFRKTAMWTASPTQEEINKTFEEHDMKVVGPPLQTN
ncbi:MAG: cupin [Ignavibacteria bacterium GWB2_35_12]|nr:MAG: cupin [Ignavibacteria bacterium GWB2_35_12]OGU95766.1 MAG: cupin [Ignavibacteria bacterium RIFOXYA2_FULL_35_10]OGV21355.1 MAG: cupin [Ignavibacteria bacterium RIFOXYC2_FULL_35_21]